ncbi:MAG TPA: TonB-dependent receptor [Kofleriaceae bacterium]|nr:TonB-dependent receptor [Kofleriaceae bacterium]
MHRLARSRSLLSFALLATLVGGASAQPGPTDHTPPADTPPADPPPPPAEPPPAQEAPPAEPLPPPAEPAPVAVGVVKGMVIDTISGEGLPAATIQIKGGAAGDQTIATELDGTFELKLPPGTYTIDFSTPEYIPVSKPITVVENKQIDWKLGLAPVPKTATGETIEIYDAIDTRKESAVLAVRRNAPTVSDAVSSQEISRTPDSNAGEAMKRVVAVSVIDGRYVALRGLEGRYVTSLLNGVLLPSPEPDRNAVPLDLFPTNLLATMTVYKSYSAELPGQFGGGTLGIATSSFPTKFEMRVGVSTSANTTSTGQTGLSNAQANGLSSFLGFDDGSRALPTAIPRNQAVRGMDPTRMEQIGEALPNVWTPTGETVTPNLSVNAMVGDSRKLAGKRVGYLATAMLRRNFSVKDGTTARTALVGGELMPIESLDYKLGTAEATLGALGNVGIDLDADNQLNVLGLYTHVGEDQSSLATGFSETDSTNIDVTRLSFVERQLGFAQLLGTHKLSRSRGLELRWQANVARTRRDELDTRDLTYTVDAASGARYYKDQPGSGQHFWQELIDLSGGGGVDVRMKAGDRVQLRAGGAAQLSNRELGGRRFRYKFVGSDTTVRGLDAEQMFDAEHIGPDFQLEEGTLNEDAYKASLDVYGAYATSEVELHEKLRAIGGVRYERAGQDLSNGSRYAVAGNVASVARTDNDLLPAANLVFAPRPDMNVRAAYSYTLVRPRFRELAPFLYFDYVRRRDISGNPDLVTTHIHNGDLRWEWFPADDEVFAASVFYKRFVDPIEQVLSNANSDATFRNAASGNLVGAEIEARTSLARITPVLAKLRLGANLAVMRSRVELGAGEMLLTSQNRPLYGQSPYVVNVNLGYADPKLADVNLLYNVIGRRITDVGVEGLPDTYEAPLHRLDLVAARALRDDLRLKLSVSNLLNQRVQLQQDDIVVNSYAPGVSFALGLDWTP